MPCATRGACRTWQAGRSPTTAGNPDTMERPDAIRWWTPPRRSTAQPDGSTSRRRWPSWRRPMPSAPSQDTSPSVPRHAPADLDDMDRGGPQPRCPVLRRDGSAPVTLRRLVVRPARAAAQAAHPGLRRAARLRPSPWSASGTNPLSAAYRSASGRLRRDGSSARSSEAKVGNPVVFPDEVDKVGGPSQSIGDPSAAPASSVCRAASRPRPSAIARTLLRALSNADIVAHCGRNEMSGGIAWTPGARVTGMYRPPCF